MRSPARSLGLSGIVVNAVSPGVTETIGGYSPEHRAAQNARPPLGRIATPEDIAEVASFMISNGARYMTGEVVIVNGGANFG
jgi:3-oxoacyl-[acyl-carrier protein] reductase